MGTVTGSWNNRKITTFVRQTLGCTCPDKVFEKIECQQLKFDLADSKILRIVIGDTLLVYIISLDRDKLISDVVRQLVSLGRADRDSNNYNRFRLVLSRLTEPAIKQEVLQFFQIEAGYDDKLHLHFVAENVSFN